MGSEKSLSVFPTPFKPFDTSPPSNITEYDTHPTAIAPLMSESGAGSDIGGPLVVIACIPKSSNSVLAKIYTPAQKR